MYIITINKRFVGYPVVRHDISEEIDIVHETIQSNIKSKYSEYNLICTGTSGLYIATMLKARAPKMYHVCYMGKHGEQAHRGQIIDSADGNLGAPSIFIDDFVESGSTMDHACELWNGHVSRMKMKLTKVRYAVLLGTQSKSALVEACERNKIKFLIHFES